ncbi:MAG: glycosyltransferase family 2 protein, partial [Acidimicrobiia bacterium]
MPHPRVTILLPVFDEAAFIDPCLQSLANQDYPGVMEVLIADGGSRDGTRERAETWTTALPHLRVIDNPERIQSHGLNLAAGEATGEILIRADAHTAYATDYVLRSVETLLDSDATAVGGVQVASGHGSFGKAVAEAMGTPLAIGPARFRHTSNATEADTVYLGALRKSDWERLGGWRTLPSGVAEDADLYFRLRLEGARILVEPRIRSTYSPRETVTSLSRQFFRYGVGKADMLYVNGRWPSWRPAAPLVLVLGLLTTVALT